MVKKESKKLEDIEVTEEILDNMKVFRGRVFKEFMTMGEDVGSDEMFLMFVENGLRTADIEVEDAYEQLSLPDFAVVLSKVMEINNMEELFRAIERLSRSMPGSESQ